MTSVVGYIRVSDGKQLDGNGPASQCGVIEAWCKRNGKELSYVVIDTVSGASDFDDRFEFADLVKTAKERFGTDTVVLASRHRLARDTMVAAMLDRFATKYGVTLVMADGLGVSDPKDPNAAIINGFLDLLAMWERMTVVTRLTNGWKSAMKYQGKMVWTPEFGWMIGPVPGSRVENPHTAPTVRKIFELWDSGWPAKQIAHHLNGHSHPTPTDGVAWNYDIVMRVINKRKYYDGTEFPGRSIKLAPGVKSMVEPLIPVKEKKKTTGGWNPYNDGKSKWDPRKKEEGDG